MGRQFVDTGLAIHVYISNCFTTIYMSVAHSVQSITTCFVVFQFI